jgi:hypothetical protein
MNGFCERGLYTGITTCMCDEECAAAGMGSCDLSPVKPLCGGLCAPGRPPTNLECGRGADVVRLEPFTGGVGEEAAAAVPSSERVVVEVGRP